MSTPSAGRVSRPTQAVPRNTLTQLTFSDTVVTDQQQAARTKLVSYLASVGTGAAAGARIGVPVGAAVGAVGGAAVSYGLGKFIDWKGGPVEQFNRSVGIE